MYSTQSSQYQIHGQLDIIHKNLFFIALRGLLVLMTRKACWKILYAKPLVDETQYAWPLTNT